MSQTAAHLVDHVIPHVPVRQWVLSLPIAMRLLLASQPQLVTPVLQVVQRVLTRHMLDRAGPNAGQRADEGHGGAVTLIQRFGSAANLNLHLHCLVLVGLYRCGANGVPNFVEAGAPTDGEMHALPTLIAHAARPGLGRAEGNDDACRSGEKLGIERGSPVREPNAAYALLFTLVHSRESLMKSIQVSWLHAAGALAIVLGTTGCAMTAPKAERYVAPPMGATWVSERRDTGSFGSATVQLPSKRGELMWEGKRYVTFETPESAIVSRPEGGWIGVFRDGKPLMMWNPPANFEWPLTVGATFSKDYSLTMYPAQQTVTYTSTSRVEAYEEVTVPAGAFKAFKVRTTDTIGNDNVVWFSPELGIFVKQNNRRTAQHAQGPGTRDIEMVSQSIRR